MKSIMHYLQENYGIIYFKVILYNQLYITDLIITAPANPFNIFELHASSVHNNKDISVLKASIEMIERLVFISPLVGPIDFVDDNAYVIDTETKLTPVSLVSPYFAQTKEFNTKGHACHTDETSAQLLAELECYEKTISNNLDSYTKYIDRVYKYYKQRANSSLLKSKVITNFEFLLIKFHAYWFAVVWHKDAPGCILGSAVAKTKFQASQKALWEGISKQEIAEKNGMNLSEVAEKVFDAKISGEYHLNCELKIPHIIKRYHQALNDLNLVMYQAV
jgi:hypothetical protein